MLEFIRIAIGDFISGQYTLLTHGTLIERFVHGKVTGFYNGNPCITITEFESVAEVHTVFAKLR